MQPVAIITGGASGIGLALGQLLAERRFRVVLADADEAGLQRARNTFADDATVETARLDVTDPAAVQATVTDVATRHGRLDYLFNNAGIGGKLDMREATLAHWQRILSINLMGVIHGVQAAYPLMVKQGSGHLVNTASISGLMPWPGQVLYSTTKYAVVGLSLTLREEAARFGVKVSVVCPGPVQSAIWGVPILGERGPGTAPPESIPASEAAETIWRGLEADEVTIIFPEATRQQFALYRADPDQLKEAFAAQLHRLLPP